MRSLAQPARIICVGNRLVAGDDVGPRVFDVLRDAPLPPGIDLLDGGLQGLDLARHVEGAERVVFVDTVLGAADGEVAVVPVDDAIADASDTFGHGSGLAYLLNVLPGVLDGPLPETAVIGAGPGADAPTIGRVARACVEAVTGRAAASRGGVER